jgi:hypothetical protein
MQWKFHYDRLAKIINPIILTALPSFLETLLR